MEDDQSWRTATFRQSVVNKINEAISSSDVTPKKNTVEMENHVFSKARNKDEYLSFVARLIIHVREMNTKNKSADGGNSSQNVGPGNIQDPINALQNLTNQGARNVQPPMMGQQQQPNPGMMMGNQHQQPNVMNQQGPGMIRPQQMPPNQGMNQMSMNPNVKGPNMNVGNQMNPMAQMNQMGPQGNPQQQMSPMMNQQMNSPGMMRPTNPMISPMPNVSNPGQMMNMQQPPQGQRMMNPIGPQGPGNFGPQGMPMRAQAPPFSMRQSPSPMGVQSPMSASHAMVPSPAMNVPSPQAPNMGSQRIPNPMAPSPSANMNTPGQPPSGDYAQSPMNPHDDQVYREKYQQLTKYKEPLKRMISRATVENNAEKMQKLKKLLEILSNPETRISLDTLLKCEIVLVNQFGALKDQATTINNPLYDAIASNLQNPLANHTIQKTFKPSVEAWFGPDIKNLPPTKKRRLSDEEKVITNTLEIPHLLQGEIARLDSKFKISLDQTAHANGSKSIKLICCLDDKLLPCVPTISITIPEDYPMMSPQTTITEHDTPFLKQVESALKARISKLPERFSLTHVLETWVLAIRQACNPAKYIEPTQTSVLLAI